MALQQQQQQHSQHHWQKQAQQLWKPQPASQVAGAGNSQAEVAPVPWNTFAADDCGDDLDKDLQELIMLPPADCMQQPAPCAAADAAAAAAAPAATGPAAAAKARSSSLRRIGSTASTHSTVDMLNATALGQANSSGSGSKTKRVLRIRNAKGSSGAVGGNSTGSGGSTGTGGSRIVLKGSTARRNITQQQQVVSAALGPIKAGVQKKTTASASKGCGSSSSPNKLSPSTVTGSPAKGGSMLGAAAVLGSKPLQEQQQCVLAAAAMQVDEEPSLSLLGDLDSCLSGGDAMTAGVMPGDDYWEGFMQVCWGAFWVSVCLSMVVCVGVSQLPACLGSCSAGADGWPAACMSLQPETVSTLIAGSSCATVAAACPQSARQRREKQEHSMGEWLQQAGRCMLPAHRFVHTWQARCVVGPARAIGCSTRSASPAQDCMTLAQLCLLFLLTDRHAVCVVHCVLLSAGGQR